MQSQFSLFSDPVPPAHWVTPPPPTPPKPQDVVPKAETEPKNLFSDEFEAAPEIASEPQDVVVETENLETLPIEAQDIVASEENLSVVAVGSEVDHAKGLFCPNCGSPLEGRKCKLLCLKPGCGYMVTCSEW